MKENSVSVSAMNVFDFDLQNANSLEEYAQSIYEKVFLLISNKFISPFSGEKDDLEGYFYLINHLFKIYPELSHDSRLQWCQMNLREIILARRVPILDLEGEFAIDLHFLQVAEAREVLERIFLFNLPHLSLMCHRIKIIFGRGKHTPQHQKDENGHHPLKKLTLSWLKQNNFQHCLEEVYEASTFVYLN